MGVHIVPIAAIAITMIQFERSKNIQSFFFYREENLIDSATKPLISGNAREAISKLLDIVGSTYPIVTCSR